MSEEAKSVEIGLKGEASVVVTDAETAAAVKSGSLAVFATPEMIRLVEEAACNCLKGYLADGYTSVGTNVNVSHLAPTPVGATVTAVVTVREVTKGGRAIEFDVLVTDNVNEKPVGKGTHSRFSVNAGKFMAGVDAKAKKL
eukprot:TRINITY_DN66371_c5_g1_i1.p2 TRINITY_DN66371_c5_g1~~TRINITY_DN66371_c5_g1_i1.p2  ORF type:complete len:150 (+),score=64.98 TRINITY_DN66371_c5_g1_i1:29-451(+)